MDVKTKCVIAENLCELAMGGAAGIILNKTVIPKCTKGEALLVLAGSMVAMWKFGNDFGNKFYKHCDAILGTDFTRPGVCFKEEGS